MRADGQRRKVDGGESRAATRGHPGDEAATTGEPLRLVAHFDLDAFYASVETALRPELSGRAVAVGGTDPGGIVVSATYPARDCGVRAAMPVAEARSLCPQLIVVAPRLEAYRRVSRRIAHLAARFGPVLMTSPDEGAVTLTGMPELGRWAWAAEQARQLRTAVADTFGLGCSVGVARTGTVAKIASDLAKPGGVVICDDPAATLAPLPVQVIPGVGPVSADALNGAGIRTVADLRNADRRVVARLLGERHAAAVLAVADGGDPPPALNPSRQAGSETTLERPVTDPGQVVDLARRAGGEAYRRSGDDAIAAVTVKLRGVSRRDVTRSRTLRPPTRDRVWLRSVIEQQTDAAWAALGEPARLVGVTFELGDGPDQPQLLSVGEPLEIPDPPVPTFEQIAWARMPVRHPVFGDGVLLALEDDNWRVDFHRRGEKLLAFDAPLSAGDTTGTDGGDAEGGGAPGP